MNYLSRSSTTQRRLHAKRHRSLKTDFGGTTEGQLHTHTSTSVPPAESHSAIIPRLTKDGQLGHARNQTPRHSVGPTATTESHDRRRPPIHYYCIKCPISLAIIASSIITIHIMRNVRSRVAPSLCGVLLDCAADNIERDNHNTTPASKKYSYTLFMDISCHMHLVSNRANLRHMSLESSWQCYY